MLIRKTATMLNLILHGLARLLPDNAPARPEVDWAFEDCSWYSSSFDLARGLEVIEHGGVPTAVFSDTQPAYHSSRA